MEDLQDKIIELMDLFDGEVTTADKIDRPQRALDREAIDDFMKRNPMAGGGMLVQPSADGSRPGYRSDKVQTAKEIEVIKLKTEPLNKAEKLKLYRSYDDLFRQEYKRLVSIGDPFSKTDLNRAVINRIANENPTINLREGIGLDKIPGGGNEESKTLFERYDKTARGPLFTKKELKNFTQGNAVNARVNTKTQEAVFKLILNGNSDKTQLAKTLGISEGRLSYNIEKLMRNLAKGQPDQYTFLKDYKEKDLEKVRNNIYESPTLEKAYQRTIIQSVLQSTKLGSPERKQALNKLKEFNKFKEVMLENGIDPKILALDHAASYRAIKNGNIKTFLSVTPVIKDINTLKSSFDKRSQLNLRRMRDYLLAGDTKNYKYFLKNQTELENLWKTMTGGQSSLGKIRVTATGPQKGKIKIFDYGATSLLDKNKNLINELADNLSIRQNIVNASSVKNLDEARRIMLEGSELTEKKMLGTLKTTDRAAKTQIDQSFKNLNKPEMFKAEKKIAAVIQGYSKLDKCRIGSMDGGRIGFKFSDECLRDGLNEAKKAAASGDKKAARQLVETAEAASKGGRLLKNVLGPGAILGEALFEGALIGNRLLEGKPLDQAWAASYLSYLDPRKYSGQLDPTLLQREQMLESTADKDILRSGFAAQDQLSAFNKALQDRELAKARGRTDQYNVAAADAREQGRFADQSADIISSEAFKDASNIAQEYIQGQQGQRMFPYNQFKQSIGKFESGEARDFRRQKEQEMKNLYTQFSDTQLMDMLENSKSLKAAGITPEQYMLLLGAGTKRITPAVTRTLSGLDAVRTDIQEQEALNRIAEAGGVANLAKGGRAGYKLGKLIKVKPSKVREDVKAIIDDSMKMQQKIDTTTELDKLIKKTLDEDLFDKKDRIVDSINISEAKKRRNYPYNMQVFEEPKNLDFYRDIKESDFRTKTGPYYDRIRRLNKAGGGLLKQAGDRSGPPPESGPNSQGLQGLLNRVKKV